MTIMLLGCSLFSNGQTAAESSDEAAPAVSGTLPKVVAHQQSAFYFGPTTLDQRILESSVIVRARLRSATSTVVSRNTYLGMKYFARLEFNFSAVEYLKGSGGTNIVAVWDAAPRFDTRQEAEAALP